MTRKAELKFVAEGYGIDRREVMYNDFVSSARKSDPAGIGGGKDTVSALPEDRGSQAPFA